MQNPFENFNYLEINLCIKQRVKVLKSIKDFETSKLGKLPPINLCIKRRKKRLKHELDLLLWMRKVLQMSRLYSWDSILINEYLRTIKA